jgi:hypothetical protein
MKLFEFHVNHFTQQQQLAGHTQVDHNHQQTPNGCQMVGKTHVLQLLFDIQYF